MKKIVTLIFLATTITAAAQTKVLTQAVITTKTTITSPEGEEANASSQQTGPNGEEIRMVRLGGDGETKSVTTLKGDMVKTFTETEMGRTTVLRDNSKKITTTLMEMMGNKTGFYATDEEQEQMSKRMDSMMQSRRQGNDNNARPAAPTGTEISYTGETKKIAGLVCKKAFVIVTRKNGNKDSSTVWYCPDFKLQGLPSTGGLPGFGGFGRTTTLNGLNDLAGFPMQYEMQMPRGRKMMVEVTKITTDKEVADKEFEVPKDFILKPVKDMQSGDGRGIQIRIGGGGPNHQ
jgi:GLPGLI family protein